MRGFEFSISPSRDPHKTLHGERTGGVWNINAALYHSGCLSFRITNNDKSAQPFSVSQWVIDPNTGKPAGEALATSPVEVLTPGQQLTVTLAVKAGKDRYRIVVLCGEKATPIDLTYTASWREPVNEIVVPIGPEAEKVYRCIRGRQVTETRYRPAR